MQTRTCAPSRGEYFVAALDVGSPGIRGWDLLADASLVSG